MGRRRPFGATLHPGVPSFDRRPLYLPLPYCRPFLNSYRLIGYPMDVFSPRFYSRSFLCFFSERLRASTAIADCTFRVCSFFLNCEDTPPLLLAPLFSWSAPPFWLTLFYPTAGQRLSPTPLFPRPSLTKLELHPSVSPSRSPPLLPPG